MDRYEDECSAHVILDEGQCPYVARTIGMWWSYSCNSYVVILEAVKGLHLTKDVYTSMPRDTQEKIKDEVKKAYGYLRKYHQMIHHGSRFENLMWTGETVKIIDLE